MVDKVVDKVGNLLMVWQDRRSLMRAGIVPQMVAMLCPGKPSVEIGCRIEIIEKGA